jgi:signal transduction histidine kinase/CheY-like chemotaxis protein
MHTMLDWRYFGRILLLAAAYVAGALIGVGIASSRSPVSPIWLPSGIGVAAVLLAGWRVWPAVALGALTSTLLTSGSFRVAPIVAAGATFEALAAAALFTTGRFELRRSLNRVRDMVAIAAVAIVTPAVAATIGVSARLLTGRVPSSAAAGEWVTWWTGDALGILLLTPVLLTWHVRPRAGFRSRRIVEAAALMAMLVGLSALAFSASWPTAFLLAPVLAWSAIRFGPRGASTTLLVVAFVAIWHTFRGLGPFAGVVPGIGLFVLQVFIGVSSVTILFLAAAVGERDQTQRDLRWARDELEAKVARRTALLSEANARLEGELVERQRAEIERRRLEAQVLQAQKLESLGLLAGGIAHDFNNLLTAIMGHAELAREAVPPDAGARKDLEEVETAAKRAAELAGQMLAYSGRAQFVAAPVDLSEMVREMGQLLEASISKKATVVYRLDPTLPLVEADPTQIRQVVMNLLINASEAIGQETGMITVTTSALPVTQPLAGWIGDSPKPGRYVALDVADSGCGMSEETRSKIFDPFFTTKFTGRGLGLAMVLGIVRAHKGHISVDSKPGRGTTFTVLFPPAASQARRPAREGAGRAQDWAGRGTVLVVDDEVIVRKLARAMAERCGFQVVEAADGVEALQLIESAPSGFACMLLDLTMPRMNGEETLRELRRRGHALPVILSSGYPAEGPVRDAAGFIQKPYRFADMRDTLRAATDGSGSPVSGS